MAECKSLHRLRNKRCQPGNPTGFLWKTTGWVGSARQSSLIHVPRIHPAIVRLRFWCVVPGERARITEALVVSRESATPIATSCAFTASSFCCESVTLRME
jgi:hypothetical protein